MKTSFLLSCLLALFLISLPLQAQQTTLLEGRVMLNDTLPAAYATIYLPNYGIGTISDRQGYYQIESVPSGAEILVEYAYLGYKTEQVRLALTQPNHHYRHNLCLKEQAIQLSEVYLTPNGEEPCVYILRKVHEQGLINRKRLVSYKAVCDGNFHVRGLDIFISILPPFAKTMIHGALRTFGINALFNYITSNEKVDVTYQYTQLWNKGKVRNSEMKILSSNPQMADQVRKQLSKFQEEDFFSMFYSNKKFDAKKVASRGWQLKGVVEENGHTIDVLSRTEGDSIKRECTYYIIEDLWSVLRYEERNSRGSVNRFECHDLGKGIYLPVLFVTNPMPVNMDEIFDDLKKEFEKDKANGEASKMEKKTMARFEKVLNERSSHEINLITPYSIKYSDVVIRD